MSPRSLPILLPTIFAASLGLGYALAPREKRTTETRIDVAATTGAATSGTPESQDNGGASSIGSVVENKAATTASMPQSPATAEDVFAALGSMLYSERAYRVQEAINRLDVPQLEAVLDQIDSIGRFDQAHVLPRVIDRLMDLDPQKGLGWLQTNAPTFREGSATFTIAFEMACKKDPDGARRIFDATAEGDRRNAMGGILIRYMATKDPAAAYAWLKAFPNGTARDQLAAGYVEGLAVSNPTSAISQALKWNEGTTRKATLTTAFLTLARAGQGQALAALDQIRDSDERGELLGRLAARARLNELPALAAYYESAVQQDPKIANRFDGVKRIADGLARTNPTEAMRWANTLPEEEQKLGLSTVLSSWGWNEPLEAISWVRKNTNDPTDQKKQVEMIYRGWLETDLPKAKEWAEKLPDAEERDRTFGLVVSQHARKGQHTEALDLLARLPAKQQSELATEVAGQLAWNDPPIAARWLGNIEPDQESASLFGRVASEWAEKDFKAAGNWIGSIPTGACRDRAIISYASKVVRLDPAAASDWAATVSNESIRERLVGGMLSEWNDRDPKAAAQWLESTTSLSAERKAAFKNALR